MAIVLDAISFVLSALLIGFIRRPEGPPDPGARRSLWAEVREGLGVVVGNRHLRSIAAATGTSNLFTSSHNINQVSLRQAITPLRLQGGWIDGFPHLVAVWAVLRRELRIWSRYPSWVISLVIWPLLFPLIYLFGSRALAGPAGEGLAAFAASAGTGNVSGFIVVGTTGWMWLNITLWGVGTSLRMDQVRGMLESNWLTPAPRFALLLGIAASQAVLAVCFLVVSLVQFSLVLGIRFSADYAGALAVLGLTIPWLYGLGMTFAAGVLAFKETNAMVYIVRGLFMVFAGITFPLVVLPAWMQRVAAWLPLTHTIGGFRRALLRGAGPAELRPELCFLLWSGLLLMALGYGIFQAMDRRMGRAGSAAHH